MPSRRGVLNAFSTYDTFSLLECNPLVSQGASVSTKLHNHHHHLILEYFHHPKKKPPCLSAVTPHSKPSPWLPPIYFLSFLIRHLPSVELPVLGIWINGIMTYGPL